MIATHVQPSVDETPGLSVVRVPDPRPAPIQFLPPPAPPLAAQPSLPDAEPLPEPARADAPGLPWAGTLVRALAETFAGRRSPAQLTRWTTEEVLGEVCLHSRRPRPIGVRAWRAQSPRHGVLEVSAHLSDEGRSRAVALRLECRQADRWICTALRVG